MDDAGSWPARTRLVALAACDAAALISLRPRPGLLVRLLTHPAAALGQFGADRVVVPVATAALWLVAAWVALGLLAALGARLPGLGGRVCAAVASVALPATLRRVVIGALGVGLLAGPATAALAGPPAPAARAVAAAPVAALVTTPPAAHGGRLDDRSPGPSWPTSTTAPSRPGRHAPDGADTVRVGPGDSLWLIAGRRLGAHASPDRIAAYWPRVYAANRAVVGPDPGFVIPGQVLHLPDPRTS